jgi:hypothetical protein
MYFNIFSIRWIVMKNIKSDINSIKPDNGKAVTGIMIIPVIAEGKSNQVIAVNE